MRLTKIHSKTPTDFGTMELKILNCYLVSGFWPTTMSFLKHAIYYPFKVTSAFSKS